MEKKKENKGKKTEAPPVFRYFCHLCSRWCRSVTVHKVFVKLESKVNVVVSISTDHSQLALMMPTLKFHNLVVFRRAT